MNDHRQVPASLRGVAVVFILWGICSLIEVVVALANRWIDINFGVLGLFIGPGLLALRPGWRTWALVFIWIYLVGTVIFALLVLQHSVLLGLSMIGRARPEIGMIAAAIALAIALWSYWVLTRPDIRQLFDHRAP